MQSIEIVSSVIACLCAADFNRVSTESNHDWNRVHRCDRTQSTKLRNRFFVVAVVRTSEVISIVFASPTIFDRERLVLQWDDFSVDFSRRSNLTVDGQQPCQRNAEMSLVLDE